MHSDPRREQRVTTDCPASVYKVADPYWRIAARVANISANGLLLKMPTELALDVGAKINVRFAAAAVAGQVKHVSKQSNDVLVGIAIEDVQYL
jgi:hypothetical protein